MQGLKLTQEQLIELLSAYSSVAQSILAVDAEPGWNVVGAFSMPASADIRLDLIGAVSDPSLTMRGRLYCVTAGYIGEVSGSRATISSTTDVEAFSGQFQLVGGRLYQIQIEVVGRSGDDYFGLVRRAAPMG